MKVYVKAPAKINLFLFINGILKNGFHDLSMLMQRVSLFDEIEIETNDSQTTILKSHSNFDLGPPEKNLVYKASEIFRSEYAIKEGVTITLNKKIPVQAGLGGGSSDGAAVLRGLNDLFSINAPPLKLAEMGIKIGSDVPFFCYERPMYVEGKGDVVHEVSIPKLSILLVKPSFSLSTKLVYEKYDEIHSQNIISHSKFDKLTDIINSVKREPRVFVLDEIYNFLQNDLEPAAFKICPEIKSVKDKILDAGADRVLMSGSGSCVFGIFNGNNACENAKLKLQKEFAVWAVETIPPHYEKPAREG